MADTSRRAIEAEAAFIMVCARNGWEVAQPVYHAQGYDFVFRRNRSYGWETVQVKAAFKGRDGRRNATWEVSLRRCNEKGARPYSKGDFEWLYVHLDAERQWLIPWKEIAGVKSGVTVWNRSGAAKRVSGFLLAREMNNEAG